MNALRQALADYLAVRRVLGYRLVRAERLLNQFLTFLEARGESHLTIEAALAWATLPDGGHRGWLSMRLSAVRRFAVYLRGIDPATEVPPSDLLPGRTGRATPYLYSEQDIAVLMTMAAALRVPHHAATYQTLIALLWVSGMRVGEAIGLDHDDFDAASGFLTIRNGKFGKSRSLPLHSTAARAIGDYLRRRDRPTASTAALFVSTVGTRLFYPQVQAVFHRLVHRARFVERTPACRPRLHDLRHSFAVRTLLDAYRGGGDPATQLTLLSTYLGHVDPGKTYWYLSAAPELMALAGERLERHLGGGA
jgi:integrase